MIPTSGRLVAVDYGKKRIGLAISDPGQILCSPADVLAGTGNLNSDAAAVARWAAAHDAAALLVGLPLNMDSTDSDQTRLVRAFASALAGQTRLPIELFDERLSTFAADQAMGEAAIPPRKRAKLRDALSAQLILKSFLEARSTLSQPDTSEPETP